MTQLLTKCEHEALQLLTSGLNNVKIAMAMGISNACLDKHMRALLTKLEASNRVELVAQAFRRGLVR